MDQAGLAEPRACLPVVRKVAVCFQNVSMPIAKKDKMSSYLTSRNGSSRHAQTKIATGSSRATK
eukprot:3533988-Amphidinium_carterae.1